MIILSIRSYSYSLRQVEYQLFVGFAKSFGLGLKLLNFFTEILTLRGDKLERFLPETFSDYSSVSKSKETALKVEQRKVFALPTNIRLSRDTLQGQTL